MATLSQTLKKIDAIKGLLVPGQERTLISLGAFFKGKQTIVEIGSYLGKSTVCFGIGSDKDAKIFSIDTFEGNKKDFIRGIHFREKTFLDKFKENISTFGIQKKVIPTIGYSQEVGTKWNKKIDLLFIDGSHVYEDVKKDFELYFPWVKPGGIVAFHDVTKAFPGVYKVWNEQAKKKLVTFGNTHTLYFGFKKGGKNKKYYEKKIQEILGFYSNKVFVTIPVHNRLEYTIKCLDSLEKQTYKNFHTILIDDGSTDGTSAYVKLHYPKTKIIKGTGNWWWTRSMNEGVKRALKMSKAGDFVLSMNNDCFFNKNYLAEIVKASQENGRAVVGSLILDAKDKKRVIDAGVKIVWKKGLIYGIADKISNDVHFYSDRQYIKDVDTLPGKGTLIPIEVIQKVGNFNYVLLPHYIGDYEFFCRTKKYGYDLIVSSRSKLYNFFIQPPTTKNKNKNQRKNLKEILFTLFGRKSKTNVLDITFFVLLQAPKKYLVINLLMILSKLTSEIGIIYVVKLFLHNLPIRINQNFAVAHLRLFFHNIPIYIKQNKFIKKGRWF